MKEDNLIRRCRYYGKPYISGDDEMFLFYESVWVKCMVENPKSLEGEIREYKQSGLEHFSEDDKVPMGIKAILFNRYMHWKGGYGTEKKFKEWYLREYLKKR